MSRTKANRGKSGNKSAFSFGQVTDMPRARSVFNRSHAYKTTMDGGYLVPVLVEDIYPGDSINLRINTFMRMATPLHAVMDNLIMTCHVFFTPWRIVWDDFEAFMGEREDPDDDPTTYVLPKITAPAAGWTVGTMADYFGLPIGKQVTVQSLPFRCMNKIWNDWYRAEQLQDSVPVKNGSPGPDYTGDFPLKRRGKRHDYITASLPYPQLGPAVTLPLGTTAPLVGNPLNTGSDGPTFQKNGIGYLEVDTAGGNDVVKFPPATSSGDIKWADPKIATDLALAGIGGVMPYADLQGASSATVNEWREAVAIQQLYEREARSGGMRYQEIIRSAFQVVAQDYRLQRPEYIGGFTAPINVNPVPQTSESATTPQANISAYVTSSHQSNSIVKSFVEHGSLIAIVNVRAALTYQQRIDKWFKKSTKYDFMWPELHHIGEQAVKNYEVFSDGSAEDDEVWGYQERYSEMRTALSKVTGLFRSESNSGLDSWHLALDFGDTRPQLNDTFIEDNPPVSRVIAVPSEPEFLFDAWFDFKHIRPLPVYGTPGLRRL